MARPARLTVLGSGSALPRADRATSAYLVEDGAGGAWLVDLGPGVLHRAARAGIPLPLLSGVLVTHVHPDHCADLVALAFALSSPSLAWDRGPVAVRGHEDLVLLHARLRNAWPGWLAPGPRRLDLAAVVPGALALPGGPSVEAFRVAHHRSSLGYRLVLPDGFVLAFSGDATEGADLEHLGRGADLFVLEAAGSERGPIPGHLTPARAGAVAARAGAAAVLLTHFYPQVLEDPIGQEAGRAFEGRLSLAQDGLIVPLTR